MTDTTPLTGEELAAMLRRAEVTGSEAYHQDVPRLVAEVERLRNVLHVVTTIKDRLLEEKYAEHPEVPHP